MTEVMGLRDYQREAVRSVTAGLSGGGLGQLEAACGTGKTLISQRCAEQLVPERGLIAFLAPSLALVAQTLLSWTREARIQFQVMAVCGDDTVADAPIHLRDLVDLDVPVSTDAEVIADWMRPRRHRQVLIGTYRSQERIAEALRARRIVADLLICDEAHTLAGRTEFASRQVLDRAWFPARRTLFMTATRRIGTYGGDADVVSMDDEATFGPLLFRYPFADAIRDGHLKDYRVAVIGVTDAEGRQMLAAAGADYVDRPGAPDLRTVVAQAALAQAHREYGLRRVLTYHPRVAIAAEFSRTLASTVRKMGAPNPLSGIVHGRMNQTQRQSVLRHLVDPPEDGWTVVSNSRCLGVGVDIPAVDAVMFAHPKRSAVDIVQAVGRALRLSPDADRATIIIPVIVPDEDGEIDDLDAGEYSVIWEVVRALRAHDETLAAELDTQRSHMHGEAEEVRLPPRITIELPPGVSDRILQSLQVLLLRHTTSSWLEGLAAAQAWHREHDDINEVPGDAIVGGFALGRWLPQQRASYRKGRLRPEHVAALEALGFSWDLRYRSDAEWIALASEFHRTHGHLNVPQKYRTPAGDVLGSWLSNQRSLRRQGSLPQRRIAALDELGMIWDGSRSKAALAALQAWHAEHGHLRVPEEPIQGLRLREWLNGQRMAHREGRMTAERAAALEGLGIEWEPKQAQWEQGLEVACRWQAAHGDLNVARDGSADADFLLTWLSNRRQDRRKGRLSPDRIAALDELGMIWSPHDQDWVHGLADLTDFVATHGHPKVPGAYRGRHILALSAWVVRRKNEWQRGELAPERVKALQDLGVMFAPRKHIAPAADYLAAAGEWASRTGHLRIPSSHVTEHGLKLGAWLVTRRADLKTGKIRPEILTALNAISPTWQSPRVPPHQQIAARRDVGPVAIGDDW